MYLYKHDQKYNMYVCSSEMLLNIQYESRIFKLKKNYPAVQNSPNNHLVQKQQLKR